MIGDRTHHPTREDIENMVGQPCEALTTTDGQEPLPIGFFGMSSALEEHQRSAGPMT
ncbi:hypothetical protein KIN20_015322 [Parelaphostrongylus tenuis]|uniref:Uncharacterized protein n=1 Tax=Parelaphostrongylus tenuis TaxID=148309 RepID=A0AAD5N433_PARTN|nr:hypothetical protein KIN20_015322 [Parelaphostrongylus tenuis]